ncbi:proline-serine-threonine phosphatase-interacting protein 2 [Ambystoma mexicanum]|uniref:proline-serine-threonine phosphatase-interacting protein 2 n=1 Tax=Ambystoma mexicanum TaxID=8296 RepID=UPI0037E814A6
MKGTYFKDNFWSTDITSTAGYDAIICYSNEGRKNCKEFEDFVKERASIEERYGKDLVNLTKKKPCGQTEINTLKRSLDVFKQQIENVGQFHLQLANTLRDEARKMEEFREKQKLSQKRTDNAMDIVHKQKQTHYKKTMDAKRIYEQRCREKEEADLAVNRNANNVNQKQQDKLFTKLAQAKVAAEDADKAYQLNLSVLDKVREDWQNEHTKACVFLEAQDTERRNYFRNAVWTHLNQLSQQCVTSDVMYEEVRKSLEMCSIQKDIEYFVENKKTGDIPPVPIPYENFHSAQKNTVPGRNCAPAGMRRGPLPPSTKSSSNSDYDTVNDYSQIQHYDN